MARSTNDRIIGSLIVGLALLGLLWGRCVWLQIVSASRYTNLVDSQNRSVQTMRALRGAMYDSTGKLLAVSVPVTSIFANPRRIEAKQDVARELARVVGKDARSIQKRLEKDKGFVWIARQLDTQPSDIQAIDELSVGLTEEPKRYYPQGRLASHVLGFVDVDQRGLEGIELMFNSILQGKNGWRSTLRDAKGEILIGPWTVQANPIDGYDMVLTIDAVVQQIAEDTLEWGVTKYHAKGGSIIVMDPYTGAIRAMATEPSYDPNVAALSRPEVRRNRAVTDMFEPGSIFKIVTASALLEEGLITPEEKIFCENGSYPTVAHHVLHDHQPHGTLSFHDVIKFSSNIGTAKAAQRLKPDELYKYIQAFGFGRKTGIELPGEVGGMTNPPSRWSKLSPFIIPIGQEIAVTPIQLAVMTSVIANGGLKVHPYILGRIQEHDGEIIRSYNYSKPERIISPTTAATLQEILTSVVESGTGQLANVKGLTVAGKTGTAQKLEPTGRYSHSRFVASFVGFGPVPDSRFVIVVSVDEPHPLYFGGVVSAPLFKRMVEQLAGYWNLDRLPAARSNNQVTG